MFGICLVAALRVVSLARFPGAGSQELSLAVVSLHVVVEKKVGVCSVFPTPAPTFPPLTRPQADDDDVDTTGFYDVLGVEKSASVSEIRRAYLTISKSKDHPRRHPDKGGDPRLFAELQNAYEVLSDEDKRAAYDRGGEAATKEGGGGGGHGDLFDMLFGGGRGPQGPRQAQKTEHPLRVSLEDVFRGKTVRVGINRTILAPDPAGGLVDSRTGKRYTRRQDRDVLEVTLDRGARDGQRITFAGKGDVQPGMLPGDVVFVVQVAPHAVFQRQGADLVVKKTVPLLDALTGVVFTLPTLGGGALLVKSPAGAVVKPGDVLEVPGEGLPVLGHSQVKGSIFVKFDVTFPERCEVTQGMKKILADVLKSPLPAPGPDAAGATEAVLRPVDVGQLKQREQLSKDAYDSDEGGDEGGGGGVQCAQQ